METNDSLQITDQKVTPEGYLQVTARLSRTGIQEYYLAEMTKDYLPDSLKEYPHDSIVRLYRSPDEVFGDESMSSIGSRPVTDGHPPVFVNAENYSMYSKGVVVGQPRQEDSYVVADLLIQDKETIEKVKNGTKQISLGYNLDMDWTPGVSDEHGVYDGAQRNIRVNHIAIVPQGRGGPHVRIQDENKQETSMKTRLIDGISVEFSEQGAQVVDKLQTEIESMDAEIKKVKQVANDAIAKAEKLEGELAVKDKEIEQLKAVDVKAEAEKLFAVIDSARKLAKDLDHEGLKTELEIKSAAIKATDASYELEGKSQVYIDGIFDTLLKAKENKTETAMDSVVTAAANTAPESFEDKIRKAREAFSARSKKENK